MIYIFLDQSTQWIHKINLFYVPVSEFFPSQN